MNLHKNTAIYLRLSSEDEVSIESISIGNQRKLIHDYIKMNLEVDSSNIIEFLDDGYSGTNFNRPGIQALLESVKSGEIDCIIVKDLSRFGRNYIEVGKYIENIFPLLNIRFIAINDNYDSNSHKGSTAELDVSFRNLIYDFYSKDLSNKIISSKKMQMESGEWTTGLSFYGYRIDPKNSKQLVIDEVSSKIVLRIFNEYIEGKTTGMIAKELNAEKILTPMLYKRSLGINWIYKRALDKNNWLRTTVRHILDDERYTGKYIGNKSIRRITTNNKQIRQNKEDWIIVEDIFPVIITKEIFEKALKVKNEIQSSYGKDRKNNDWKYQVLYPRLFYSKIQCKCCGLYFERKGKKTMFYRCRTPRIHDTKCFTGKIYENELAEMMKKIFNDHIRIAIDMSAQKSKSFERKQELIKNREIEIYKLSHDIKFQEEKASIHYEKYRNGDLSVEEFIEQKLKQSELLVQKKCKVQVLIADLKDIKKSASKKNDILETLNDNTNIGEITRELLDKLIESIQVGEHGEIELNLTYADLTQ